MEGTTLKDILELSVAANIKSDFYLMKPTGLMQYDDKSLAASG